MWRQVHLAAMTLYKQLADDITVLIREGTLRPGERVPCVRETLRDKGPRGHRAIIEAARKRNAYA
jgi:DNA-binding GntR family transcriptional regulator